MRAYVGRYNGWGDVVTTCLRMHLLVFNVWIHIACLLWMVKLCLWSGICIFFVAMERFGFYSFGISSLFPQGFLCINILAALHEYP